MGVILEFVVQKSQQGFCSERKEIMTAVMAESRILPEAVVGASSNGHGKLNGVPSSHPDFPARKYNSGPDLYLMGQEDPTLRAFGVRRLSSLLQADGAGSVLRMIATAGGEVKEKIIIDDHGEKIETGGEVAAFEGRSEISVNGFLGTILIAQGTLDKYTSTTLHDPAVLRTRTTDPQGVEQDTYYLISAPVVEKSKNSAQTTKGKITVVQIGKEGVFVHPVDADGSDHAHDYTRRVAEALGEEVRVFADIETGFESAWKKAEPWVETILQLPVDEEEAKIRKAFIADLDKSTAAAVDIHLRTAYEIEHTLAEAVRSGPSKIAEAQENLDAAQVDARRASARRTRARRSARGIPELDITAPEQLALGLKRLIQLTTAEDDAKDAREKVLATKEELAQARGNFEAAKEVGALGWGDRYSLVSERISPKVIQKS